MNKNLIFIFLIIFLPLASSLGDFAYVVKDTTGIDQYLIEEVESQGYTLDIIAESSVPITDFSKYRMIIVGDQNLDYPTNIPITEHRTIIINSYDFYKRSLTDYQMALSSAKGTKSSPTSLELKTYDHPIASGIPDKFNAYTITNPNLVSNYLKGTKPLGTTNIAYSSLDSDVYIAAFNPGNRLLNNKIFSKRAVFFGITKPEYRTEESRALFENSINWVLYGEDRDSDGFTSDNDCNDNNSNINPAQEEIPYDNIDQDCSGSDLTDIDEDGFDSVIVQGLDCDDLDSDINPDSPDLVLNCLNDAPMIEDVIFSNVEESELLEIEILAQDPENDLLIYSINDSRFTVNNNILSWQTDFDSSGQYSFKVFASDGNLSDSYDLRVRILNQNRDPILNTVPNLVWDEGSSYILNLSEYFTDPENDPLTFGVEDTSDNEYIQLEVLDSGLYNFSSISGWVGEDWIIFWAYDGQDKVLSNEINLLVNNINDAPIFKENISNIQTLEDNPLEEFLDLNDYFEDRDSNLTFTVHGNKNVSINISRLGIVSLYLPLDYYGNETIYFRATDENYTSQSNEIEIIVADAGEKPQFSNLSCEYILEEDSSSSCIIEVTDVENDPISLSIKRSNKMNCTISDNILDYTPLADYSGQANCEIIASDNDGNTSLLFNVNVTPVNDAPIINSYSTPLSYALLEGESKTFTVNTTDIDSQLSKFWLINGAEVARGSSSFNFNKARGSYTLSFISSDNEYNKSQSWNIFVGSTADFTCSEISGVVCSEDYVCSSSSFNTKDSSQCCLSSCMPIFQDAEHCEELNSSLEIKINKPKSSESNELGSTIKVEIEIKNNLDEAQELDVLAQIYNLEDDEVVGDSVDTETTVSRSGKKVLTLNLPIEKDIDLEDGNYSLFVKAEDSVCNQNYIPLKLKRPKHDVIIDKVSVTDSLACGEISEAKVYLENLGTSNEDVKLTLENKKLKISEKVDVEIEKYDKDNKIIVEFPLEIPSKLSPDTYTFDLVATYDSTEKATASFDIDLECLDETKTVSVAKSQNSSLDLTPVKIIEEKSDGSKLMIFIGIISLIATLVVVALFIYLIFKK